MRNMNTVRKIAYFESVCLYKAGEWNTPSMLIKTSTARKQAWGNGSLDKPDVYKLVSKLVQLAEPKKGGFDQADSYTIAKGARKLWQQ
jgi:Holliday junction resolvasome RuvABC endonuclease subunit